MTKSSISEMDNRHAVIVHRVPLAYPSPIAYPSPLAYPLPLPYIY